MIIHHPKVIISPQKCPFFPQKPHLFNIFTLKNDLRTFVENCRESHLRDIMGQIAQDAWIRGWGGGQPNLGNACILGASVPGTPPSASATCIYGIDNTNWQGLTCTSVPQFGSYHTNVFVRGLLIS